MMLDKVVAHVRDGARKSSTSEQFQSRLLYRLPSDRLPIQPPRWTIGDAVLVSVCGGVWGLSLTYLLITYWEML